MFPSTPVARSRTSSRPRASTSCRQLDARANIGFAVEPASGADSEPRSTRTTSARMSSGAKPSHRTLRSAELSAESESGAARSVADDHDAGADHGGSATYDLAPWSNNDVSRRPAAQQRDPPTRCRPLRLGAGVEDYGRRIVARGHRRVPASRWRGDVLRPPMRRSRANRRGQAESSGRLERDMAELFETEDGREGLRSFVERREARFAGR